MTTSPRRGAAMTVICATQLMVILDGTIVNVALPTIRSGLGFSDLGLAWMVNGFFVAFAGLLLPAGRLGDRWGLRRVFMVGLVVFTAASAWCGLAWSPEVLVLARVTQGAGAALASAVVLTLVADLYPESGARARAFGLLAFVGAGGASVGVVAGGLLTELAGWRWVFLVNVPLGLAALAGASVLLADAPAPGPGGPGVLRSLRDLLGVPRFAAANAVLVAMTVAGFSFQFLSALYLQDVLGYGAMRTGLSYLTVTAAIAVASLLVSARAAAAWGGERVLLGGLALFVGGLVLLARLPVEGSYLRDVAPALLVLGVGFGLAMPQVTTLAMGEVDPRHGGLGSGVVTTAQQLGGALGLAVVVPLAAARSRSLLESGAVQEAAWASGERLGLLLGAGALTVGVALASYLLRTRPDAGRVSRPAGAPPTLERC